MTVRERLERIRHACMSPLGYAQRGVASWEQDWLAKWEKRPDHLSPAELEELSKIEIRVFGRFAFTEEGEAG